MEVVFLGSAGSLPIPSCPLTSVYVDGYLLDCGFGVPLQLIKAGLIDDVEVVAVTHLHPDHFGGVLELIWTYYLRKRGKELCIVGPRGIKRAISNAMSSVAFGLGELPFELNIVEVTPGQTFRRLTVAQALHSVEPSFAFRVEGRKALVYSGDTSPAESVLELAEGAYLLIHEATFPSGMEDEAHKVGHSTPREAGKLAKRAGVKLLALVHLPYYAVSDPESLRSRFVREALEVFDGEVFVPEALTTLGMA